MQKSYLINWFLKNIPMKYNPHYTPSPSPPGSGQVGFIPTVLRSQEGLQGAKVSRFTPLTTQE